MEKIRLNDPSKKYRFWLSFVVVVYALAHLLPSLEDPLGRAHEGTFGWQVSIAVVQIALESLWRGEPEWLFVFGWLPNALLWLGVACLIVGRRRIPRLAGLAAGSAGCAAVVLASLWLFFGDLRELQLGYYLWAASMALLAWTGFARAAKVNTGADTSGRPWN